jgi:hypothetical protein
MPLLFLLLPPPLPLPSFPTLHHKRRAPVQHLNTLNGSQRNGALGLDQLDRPPSIRPIFPCSSQSAESAPSPSISLRHAARLFRRGCRPCVQSSLCLRSSANIHDDRQLPSTIEDLLNWYGSANAKASSWTALSVSTPASPGPWFRR